MYIDRLTDISINRASPNQFTTIMSVIKCASFSMKEMVKHIIPMSSFSLYWYRFLQVLAFTSGLPENTCFPSEVMTATEATIGEFISVPFFYQYLTETSEV